MNFLNKKWLWVVVTLIFSICLATFAGVSLLDVFVLEHTTNETVVVGNVNFGANAGLPGLNNSNGANVNEGGNNTLTPATPSTPNTSVNSGASTTKPSTTVNGNTSSGNTNANTNTNTNNNNSNSGSESSSVQTGNTILSDAELAALAKAISVTKEVGTYNNNNVSITLTEKVFTAGSNKTTYFVAHVKMSSAEYFKTALASGDQKLTVNVGKKVADLATAKNAVLAINGDGCGQSHTTGYVVRNGVQYRSSARDSSGETESLVLYGDGTMTIIDERTTPLSSVTNAWQVFSFGPGLIKNNSIAVTTNQEISGDKSMNDNPRTAIGMVEPLHYVMIVGNGRTNESKGLTLYQLAQALAYEGCTLGYNLDGGGSSTLWFNGKVINYPTTNGRYSEREVSDIVYIGA